MIVELTMDESKVVVGGVNCAASSTTSTRLNGNTTAVRVTFINRAIKLIAVAEKELTDVSNFLESLLPQPASRSTAA